MNMGIYNGSQKKEKNPQLLFKGNSPEGTSVCPNQDFSTKGLNIPVRLGGRQLCAL